MDRIKRTSSPQGMQLSLDDLIGKQSVRVTLKLPKQVIDLLSVAAAQLGIKQKSLFDQLVEDTSVLKEVAKKVQNSSLQGKNRRAKTFVISRSSLVSIEAICKQVQIPRDTLVEASIKRLKPVIDSELKKHRKRKRLLEEMKAQFCQKKKLFEKAKEFLGESDRVCQMIESQVILGQRHITALEMLVEKGKSMEECFLSKQILPQHNSEFENEN